MRKILIMAALALASCTTQPEEPDRAQVLAVAEVGGLPSVLLRQLEVTSTGGGLYIYHQVWGDCAFLQHGHGRNYAWGRWRLPLADISHGGAEALSGGGTIVRFRCTDGSACIQSGNLEDTPLRIVAHEVPFETSERAEAYLAAAAHLKQACAAPD